jgi:hypothetical protein
MKIRKNTAMVPLVMMMVILSSCSTTVKTSGIRSITMTPEITRLDIYLNDLNLLGEVEVSYEARRYFLLFSMIETVNSKPFSRRAIERVDIKGFSNISLNRCLSIAAVKAVNEYPGADFYVPVFAKKSEHRMFLGKRYGEVMRIKAYKFRNN